MMRRTVIGVFLAPCLCSSVSEDSIQKIANKHKGFIDTDLETQLQTFVPKLAILVSIAMRGKDFAL